MGRPADILSGLLGLLLVSVCMGQTPAAIEADWRYQALHREPRFQRNAASNNPVTPAEDAAGAVDGVFDGQWAFHTGKDSSPWWQVDLQEEVTLDRIVVFNRCDCCSERARNLRVLISTDGERYDIHYAHDGTVFRGFSGGPPLTVPGHGRSARYVRLQLPDPGYLHLDEVEVYAVGYDTNFALNKPATQSSTSQWSTRVEKTGEYASMLQRTLQRGLDLAVDLQARGVEVNDAQVALEAARQQLAVTTITDESGYLAFYVEIRRLIRPLSLANPLLDFESLLFVKRKPSMYPHASDQYYGWWSRGGGGIYRLDGFKGSSPQLQCLTSAWPEGNFLRPDLHYDADKLLFAYAEYDPKVADIANKVNKSNVPESAFYHVYEMNTDGSGVRKLSSGHYDDFDGRYLPDGGIVFLSTRRGQFVQTSLANTQRTLTETLPDSFVRCGGNNRRPVSVYTLHWMDGQGFGMRPVSSFESFEYTPAIAHDGRVLYGRWDYIDRPNDYVFSLWATNPYGTNPILVYGNYTARPQVVLEPRPIPNSTKLVFTASAHHSITGGSLVLLDPSKGTEHNEPIRRLTPEVPFPEREENIDMYYANPWPLSEDYYLVSWSNEKLPPHRRIGLNQSVKGQGIYLYDAFGNLELLYRDETISSMTPIPLKPRPRPLPRPDNIRHQYNSGRYFVQDVGLGLEDVSETVTHLRIVGLLSKVQPHMNNPVLGISKEDPGKYVLGRVPVEADGSAHFMVPSGVPLFFQALDANGVAVQTMRSATYVQPGQLQTCIGCHESRQATPPNSGVPLAMLREPSLLQTEPEGTLPLRFDTLVQPILDKSCVTCHAPGKKAARVDLTEVNAYTTLMEYAQGDLRKLAFEKIESIPSQTPARNSKLLAFLARDNKHRPRLQAEDRYRLILWMDTYAHLQGSFSPEQEDRLRDFREEIDSLYE